MITPEQLRDWAQDADDGEDVALDGDTLREIAEALKLPAKRNSLCHPNGRDYIPRECKAWSDGWNDCLAYIEQQRIFI